MVFDNVKIEVYLPEEFIVEIRDELNKAGALTVGKYDNVVSISEVSGYWRPLEGAKPYEGDVGEISTGRECKLEFRCKKEKASEALKIVKRIHPYEEPLINVLPVINEMFL